MVGQKKMCAHMCHEFVHSAHLSSRMNKRRVEINKGNKRHRFSLLQSHLTFAFQHRGSHNRAAAKPTDSTVVTLLDDGVGV